MTTDIYEDKMRLATVFGRPALFSHETVARNIVPDGWYCYSLDVPEDVPWYEGTLLPEDDLYYCGTILSPVPLMDGASRPLDGQISLSDAEATLADFCQQHDLAYPEDKRHFILCPDPLADAPPEAEQLLRDTTEAIRGSGLYKEFLRNGEEDYYRMELSYILSASEGSGMDRISAVAVCMDADGELDDGKTLLFHPYTDRRPECLWGSNWDRDLFEELDSGRGILYMSMSCHAAIWACLEEFAADSRLPGGVAKYLQYCQDAGITAEKMREAEPLLEDSINTVSQMMEQMRPPEGMVMT